MDWSTGGRLRVVLDGNCKCTEASDVVSATVSIVLARSSVSDSGFMSVRRAPALVPEGTTFSVYGINEPVEGS